MANAQYSLLVASLLLQSDIYQWLGKPELTPQMLLRARAIMKIFPAGTYPRFSGLICLNTFAGLNVYSDDRHIEYSSTEQWRYLYQG